MRRQPLRFITSVCVCLLVRNRYSGAHPLLGCATSSRTLSCGACIELSFAPSFLLPQCNLVESRHLSTLVGMPYTYEESRLRGPSLRLWPTRPTAASQRDNEVGVVVRQHSLFHIRDQRAAPPGSRGTRMQLAQSQRVEAVSWVDEAAAAIGRRYCRRV